MQIDPVVAPPSLSPRLAPLRWSCRAPTGSSTSPTSRSTSVSPPSRPTSSRPTASSASSASVPRERARSLYHEVLEVDKKLVAAGSEQVNGVPLIFGKRADGTPLRAADPLRLAPERGAPRVPPGPALPRHPRGGGAGLSHRRGRARRPGGQPLPQRARRQVQAPRLAHRQPARPLLLREAAPLPQRGLLSHRLARSRSAACACCPARTTSPSPRCSRARSTSSTTSPIPTSWPSPPRPAISPSTTAASGTAPPWPRVHGRRERALRLVPAAHGRARSSARHEGSATPFYFHLKRFVGY